MLLKNRGFTAVVVLTLALGIGANAALFSVVNGVLINPLPFPQPEQLVTLHQSKPNFETGAMPYPNFRDLQRENRTFSAMAISRPTGFSLIGAGEAERVNAQFVTADFFTVLGIQPQLGRNFAPGEDERGARQRLIRWSAYDMSNRREISYNREDWRMKCFKTCDLVCACCSSTKASH